MAVPCYQIDAFSNGPFTGNPAAVCILQKAADEAWMQAVAAEMNLAETAFVVAEGEGWNLRWFTPVVEVDLCGHATVATALALFDAGLVKQESTIRFSSLSGELTSKLHKDGANQRVELDFPALDASPIAVPESLSSALGVSVTSAFAAGTDILVPLESEKEVRSLAPDFEALKSVSDVRGVIVTAKSSPGDYDFVSRFFGPAVGINEDPVTGSAHCALAPFWCDRLGKQQMTGFQASQRGGVVEVELREQPNGRRRVLLRGGATIIFRGELLA